jgi:hypothetical protein
VQGKHHLRQAGVLLQRPDDVQEGLIQDQHRSMTFGVCHEQSWPPLRFTKFFSTY